MFIFARLSFTSIMSMFYLLWRTREAMGSFESMIRL